MRMETKEYELLDGRVIRAKYDRLGMCKISEENLEAFTKEFNASFRQAKILEKIKENYALMKVDERKKGKWIDTKEISTNRKGQIIHEVICSECNGISYFRGMDGKYIGANLCPNCGAEMENGE